MKCIIFCLSFAIVAPYSFAREVVGVEVPNQSLSGGGALGCQSPPDPEIDAIVYNRLGNANNMGGRNMSEAARSAQDQCKNAREKFQKYCKDDMDRITMESGFVNGSFNPNVENSLQEIERREHNVRTAWDRCFDEFSNAYDYCSKATEATRLGLRAFALQLQQPKKCDMQGKLLPAFETWKDANDEKEKLLNDMRVQKFLYDGTIGSMQRFRQQLTPIGARTTASP